MSYFFYVPLVPTEDQRRLQSESLKLEVDCGYLETDLRERSIEFPTHTPIPPSGNLFRDLTRWRARHALLLSKLDALPESKNQKP